MKVTLLSHTPNPENLIAVAAKLCYSNASIQELQCKISDELASDFVGMLSEIGHESPTEHVSFTFSIEGVSRALLAQITRHRIASYSVQSQRYVKENSFSYVVPPEIQKIPLAQEKFKQAMELSQKYYDELTQILKMAHYDKFLQSGLDEKKANSQAEKKAIEDARFILPNAC
ncbi:MAG: FAD-dependent thymidylate synthase, partial [Oscillospiraceae bacterium]